MSFQHLELASGRWFGMSFLEQMANAGSEVERATLWSERDNPDYSRRAFERALELLDLTIADAKNRGRLRELTRLREVLVDYFLSDNRYASSAGSWRSYFCAFGHAARVRVTAVQAQARKL